MQFKSLEIQNFMGIGEAEIDLLDKGLVLIQGVNNDDPSADSNGSGKSTLVDALFWCLFGKTARGLTADAVVNRVAGKECMVRVRVLDGDSEYVIDRWRKVNIGGKRAGLSVNLVEDGGNLDLTKGTDKLTQDVVNGILGCSEQVFMSAVYAAQEGMADIPSMTDRELKSLIEEAAGIDLIEEAYKIARERMREAASASDDASLKLNNALNELDRSEERRDEAMRQRDEWGGMQERKIASATNRLQEIVGEAKAIANTRDQIDLDALNERDEKLKTAIEEIDTKLSGLIGEMNERDRLQSEMSDREASLKTAKRMETRSVDELERLRKELSRVNSRVGEPCGECGKPVTEDDLSAVREGIEKKIETAKDGLDHDRNQIDTFTKQHRTAKSAFDTYVAGMTDASGLAAQRKQYQEARQTLAQRVRERERLQDRVDELKRSARNQKQLIDDMTGETNPYVVNVERAEKEVERLRERVNELEAAATDAAAKKMIAEQVVEVYGPKGVRAHILDTVTPFLNDRTAHYLGTLSDGKIEAMWSTITLNSKGEARENFAIEVVKEVGGESFAALSGGEKRKVRLACALALQDLVASRATKPINLWLGDEIDDALDEAGLERLMGVLEMKAREKGTVLIVSHRSLRDWVRDVALVTMEGGRATVSGALEMEAA